MLDADILIIGAGVAGASTAWALRELGAEGVVLLDREELPGMHASGRNAAMVRSVVDQPDIAPLLREGAQSIAAENLAPFAQVGSFLVGYGERDDLSRHIDGARGRGLFTETDGVVDVAALLGTYLRGQDVRWGTPVTGWRRVGDTVVVDTPRGPLTTRVLVNAAGAWAGELGDLPLRPLLRHLYVTPPDARIDPAWPFVWDVREEFYFRPESGGLLLCPCDESESSPGDYTERLEAAALLHEKAERLQPHLLSLTDGLTFDHHWAGQRTFADDRSFVLGWDPREPALFWVAGLGGHGVTASAAVGRRAAALLRQGPGADDELSPARLATLRR